MPKKTAATNETAPELVPPDNTNQAADPTDVPPDVAPTSDATPPDDVSPPPADATLPAADAGPTYEVLVAENEILRGRVAALESDLEACEDAYADAVEAGRAVRDGVTAMVLHVSGTEWANNERRLVRCAPSGPLADMWMVQIAGNILLSGGRGTIPARAYVHIPPSLQGKVTYTFADALERARSGA